MNSSAQNASMIPILLETDKMVLMEYVANMLQ